MVTLALAYSVSSITTVSSFKELAGVHCQHFPVDLLYRLSTGRLSELYGKDFRDIDCYIRQFVNKGTHWFTQTGRILSKRRSQNKRRKVNRLSRKRRFFLRLILWLRNTLQG